MSAGLPDWLTQFDVRTVSLAAPYGGGGTEVRFWSDRAMVDVVQHFVAQTGDAGETVDGDRHAWNTDWVDGSVRRLRTMVVEPAPGPGAPLPPDEAITVVWVSDLAVPSAEPSADLLPRSAPRPTAPARRRFWRRR